MFVSIARARTYRWGDRETHVFRHVRNAFGRIIPRANESLLSGSPFARVFKSIRGGIEGMAGTTMSTRAVIDVHTSINTLKRRGEPSGRSPSGNRSPRRVRSGAGYLYAAAFN